MESEDINDRKIYIHLSHTLTDSNLSLANGVDQIDFSIYDMLLLGGDLAQSTSLDISSIDYVNEVYNLDDPNTLWATGNHDYTDTTLIQSYTQRPLYYAFRKNNIQFIVLDTQDAYSSIVWEQKDFLISVLDTVSTASHVVLLHHKLIWMHGNADLEGQIETVSNGSLGSCFYCLNPNNFYTDIYPELVSLQEKDIQVICLGGDIGSKVKAFEHTTSEGIHFLASGVNYQEDNNQALLFLHNEETKDLTWEYRCLKDLE